MNFKLHFGELHSDNSINDKNMFENYIPKCDKVKRILISFNCFSEYIINSKYSCTSTQYINWKPLIGYFANSEDPHEMPHNAAFHQGLHCLCKKRPSK